MEQNDKEISIFDLSINETSKDHLKKIATWAIVIVICAVIGYILTIIKALQPRGPLQESEGFGVSVTAGGGIAGVILGIIIGLLVNYFLFQFANFIRKGLNGMSQTDLNTGFYNLKVYFVIVGILIIICVVIVLLVVLVVGAGSGVR
jgi:hypothetical protein